MKQSSKNVAKAAREDASRLAEERERASLKESRRKRAVRVTVILATALSLALVVMLLWGLPAIRYARANTLLESGDFSAARTAF